MLTKIILQDAELVCERVNLDPLRGSTILVTGASGLIGTHFLACLCHLRERGVPPRFLTNYGHQEEHDKAIGLTPENIRSRIMNLIEQKPAPAADSCT